MCAMQLLRVSVHQRMVAAAEDFLRQLEKEEAAELPLLRAARALLTVRLTAAADEIVALVRGTVAEQRDRAERLERELRRQRRLLDAPLKPEARRPGAVSPADVQQQPVTTEEVPPEQPEGGSGLDREDPGPLRIKEEQEELWTSQEGEQLPRLEEADVIKFQFTPVPVKREDDGDEGLEATSEASPHIKTEANGDDCGGPEAARNVDPDTLLQPVTDGDTSDSPESETDDSNDGWSKNTSLLKSAANTGIPINGKICDSGEKAPFCSECGKTFSSISNLNLHKKIHTGEKPFECSECGKRFIYKAGLQKHMKTHTGEKPFSCSLCSTSFTHRHGLVQHMRTHTGEKPFHCSVCGKRFSERGSLTIHMRSHTGEKPFSCPFCDKKFSDKGNMASHVRVHTGERPFACNVCNRRFTRKYLMTKHKCTGESSSRKETLGPQINTETTEKLEFLTNGECDNMDV